MELIQPILGLIFLFALAWIASKARSRWSSRPAVAGLAIQFGLATLALNVPVIGDAVAALKAVVLVVDGATRTGATLVLGYLGGGALPFQESFPGAAFVLAFRALPLVLVMSATLGLCRSRRVSPAAPSCWHSGPCPWCW